MQPCVVISNGREHGALDLFRVADDELQRSAAAHAVAGDVGPLDPQVAQDGRAVVSQVLVGQWPVDVGGPAVRAAHTCVTVAGEAVRR